MRHAPALFWKVELVHTHPVSALYGRSAWIQCESGKRWATYTPEHPAAVAAAVEHCRIQAETLRVVSSGRTGEVKLIDIRLCIDLLGVGCAGESGSEGEGEELHFWVDLSLDLALLTNIEGDMEHKLKVDLMYVGVVVVVVGEKVGRREGSELPVVILPIGPVEMIATRDLCRDSRVLHWSDVVSDMDVINSNSPRMAYRDKRFERFQKR
jgi:hypothetical protein